MRTPHTRLRRWMDATCRCGVTAKAHEHLDHRPTLLTLDLLAKETGVSASTLAKLSALKQRHARRGTATLVKQRYPGAPL